MTWYKQCELLKSIEVKLIPFIIVQCGCPYYTWGRKRSFKIFEYRNIRFGPWYCVYVRFWPAFNDIWLLIVCATLYIWFYSDTRFVMTLNLWRTWDLIYNLNLFQTLLSVSSKLVVLYVSDKHMLTVFRTNVMLSRFEYIWVHIN